VIGDVKAVILCGGQGTRLRDPGGVLGAGASSELLPKPLLPIGGRPAVWHIIRMLAHQGIKRFILCLGYKSWLFKDYFLNYQFIIQDVSVNLETGAVATLPRTASDLAGVEVTLAETGETTMTGGRIVKIRPYVENDPCFLVTYGDALADVDVAKLLEAHRRGGRVATLTGVRRPGRFGELSIAADRVTEFAEKPQTGEGYVNGGFIVMDGRRIWDYIDPSPTTVLERAPLERLAATDQLSLYCHDGFWQCMDTANEYEALVSTWAQGRAPWKIW